MNFTAVRVVTVLELRQRVRSTRWKWTALTLFALISAIVFGSLYLVTASSGTYEDWSPSLLTMVLMVVLFMGLIGAPAISSATINGDRRDATLALVQATPITGWELALGKFLGAWFASLVFIGVAAPYLIWGIVTARSSAMVSILTIVVLAVLLACYCAVGLGFSSLSTRPTASTMLTLATVLLLLVGLPAIYGLAMPSVERSHQVLSAYQEWDYEVAENDPDYQPVCTDRWQNETFYHTEKTWWLLAPNPVLIIFDVQAVGANRARDTSLGMGGAEFLSDTRSGPVVFGSRCNEMYRDASAVSNPFEMQNRYVGHNWYWGVLLTLLLGGLGYVTAARRLQVPVGKLAKGVRVA